MWQTIQDFFDWIKAQGPAIAILIFDWKDAEKKRSEALQKQAELELKLKENHEKIDQDNASTNDSDGVSKIAGPK